ncbi:hypothetical protein VNO77_44841 [Canavalia gladiata]|uniref:Serine/threonine-protein kinase ATM n=1 Tax=Canavalia gladiata TaxID=3824 RepID=A0AAN9JYT9_CANGL
MCNHSFPSSFLSQILVFPGCLFSPFSTTHTLSFSDSDQVVYWEVAMDVVLTAGSVDVKSGDETKMNENTIMTEEALERTGDCFDSRGRRRKSKYLSSPYTNIGSKQKDLPAEKEDLRTPCLSQKAKAPVATANPLNGSSSYAKLGSKRFRKNWHRKFISCSTMSSSPEFINASSHELISGLYSAAVDCMFPIENKSFDLVEWFFCRYRVSAFQDEAELASSLVNEKGGKIGKPMGNDFTNMKSEKKRKNNIMENAVKRKSKAHSGLSDMNTKSSGGDYLRPAKKQNKERKVEEVTSLYQLRTVEINLNEGGGNYSSVPEAPPNMNCLLSEGKAVDGKSLKIEPPQEHQSAEITSVCTDANNHKCSSLVIDLQFTSPSMSVGLPEKSNGENKELVLVASNPESCVSQEGAIGNIIDHNLLVSTTSEIGYVSVNKTRLKNRMEKAAEKPLNTKLTVEIPDLNGISNECNSVGREFETINFLSPGPRSKQSRSTETTDYIRVEDNGESLGTCLFLRFAPGLYIPSKEDLMTTFCRFGPLKASETQLLKDTGGAQVVFVRSADAAEAFRSVEQNKLFSIGGSAIVDYKLQHLSVACPQVSIVTPTQPTGPMPMPGEPRPPLQFIKQNLQMMTSILENSGDNLSPQMRAKLDAEIKNLMKKVNSRANV